MIATISRRSRLMAGVGVAALVALVFAGQPSVSAASTPSQSRVLAPRVPLDAPTQGPFAAAYHYAAAETQQLSSDYAQGASATFDVEHPKQVPDGHSLAEIAVESPAMDYTYIEAGWIVQKNKAPHLFIFWWDSGTPECYNQGCGYVQDGSGIQPGAKLKAGTQITLTWQQQDGDWWLIVNGQPSGYYPDSQWGGDFTSTGFAQVFGEVAVVGKHRVCDDMGDGKKAHNPKSATVTDVSFVDGPDVTLIKDVDDPAFHYTMKLTGSDSMRYGGPGLC